MAKEPKEYDWIRHNRKYLNIKAIADEVGVSYRLLTGYASNQTDGHGTPYKVPEKYKADLISLVKKIQSKAIETTLPTTKKKRK